MKKNQWIVDLLPYGESFKFVNEITKINEDSIEGNYTFMKSESFYESHFKDNPITPGVILTECMAQIGLVSFGISLLGKDADFSQFKIGMSSSDADFYIPVLPGEKVIVIAEKQIFRFNKLKCNCKMFNTNGNLVAKAAISGMMKIN